MHGNGRFGGTNGMLHIRLWIGNTVEMGIAVFRTSSRNGKGQILLRLFWVGLIMAAEKNFENKIKRFFDDNGCWYVKYFANRMTKSGVPDILACVNGRFIGIEVKATNGHPSELQIWNRDKIREAGGISIILYPEQWDNFVDLIYRLKNGYSVVSPKERQYIFDREEEKT